MTTTIKLEREFFARDERPLVEAPGLKATIFRYPTGIEAVRLTNARGHLVILPFMGQMIWDAVMDGVDLTMKNMFAAPRPAQTIAQTYGCFAFHSGLLRNGVPGPEDDHPAHGEFATAALDEAGIETGHDSNGLYMAVTGTYEYVMGFGAHYLARPRVTLRPDATLFEMAMEVTNLSARPMDLMYMAHVNFAYATGGQILQPAPFTPAHTKVRRAVPAHVQSNPDYLAFIEELAADPARSARLDEPERYDPEQCFYLEGLRADETGRTQLVLRRREGDGFSIAYDQAQFPKTVRWILHNSDQAVCAIALPSTCEPEGFAAEKRKGNVQSLAGHASAVFQVELGYLDAAMAELAQARINRL